MMKNELENKLINLKIDEDGLKAIALVNDPAHGSKFLKFNSDTTSDTTSDTKVLQELVGYAVIPNMPIYREGGYHGIFTKDDIRDMVEDMSINRRKVIINIEHDHLNEAVAYVSQYYQVDHYKGLHAPEGLEDIDGGLIVIIKVLDYDLWSSSDITGFSIEGSFYFNELAEDFDETDIERLTELLLKEELSDEEYKEGLEIQKKMFHFKSVGGIETHPNCKCEIVNGVWILQEGACDLCKQAKRDYSSRPGSASFKKHKKVDR